MRRCVSISKQGHQINEEIRDKEVRLVSADGEQLGIMTAQEALSKAEEANLDLVKISPNAVPPVCKLMDYGKGSQEKPACGGNQRGPYVAGYRRQ